MSGLRRRIAARIQRARDRRTIAASTLFDRDWYLSQSPGGSAADPLGHYLRSGESRSPNPLFDGNWYLDQNPDVRAAGINPLAHYLRSGAAEGRDPNPLFDGNWYLDQNPDVRAAGTNPLEHYLGSGAAKGRNPNPLFDGNWYLDQNPEVRAAGTNPLVHYLRSGAAEGRNPNRLFDGRWYLDRNPDVRAAGINPLAHYLRAGAAEGRSPNPLFDGSWYLQQNPHVWAARMNPLAHYLHFGAAEGLDPNPLFDSAWYREQNPEVGAAGLDPLVHYLMQGAMEGRAPNALFKGQWYLEQYPHVRAAGMNPLAHYLHFGAAEGRDPNPMFDTDWYLGQNPDVVRAQLNPLAHYLRQGAADGRAASPQFKGRWYIEHFPDRGTADAGVSPQWSPRQDAVARAGERGGTQARACNVVASRAGGPLDLLASAIAGAAAERRHLLVVMTGAAPAEEDIGRIAAAFDADPMIGYVAPRFADSAGLIHPLSTAAADVTSGYDRQILAHLPAFQLAPEFLAGCILVRRELVANFPDLGRHFSTMAGLLRALMAWGRRLGYRAAIANQVVVPNVPRNEAYPVSSTAERQALVRLFPDALAADARFEELPCHKREALIGRALSPGARRTLIDCTGMQPYHNGTSECILGILDGLAAIGPAWHVDIVASGATADYHELRQRYRAFNIITAPPEGFYTIAVRLAQPWALESIAELHERALHIVFLMLDTIAWDIVYAATPEVERAWRFAAAHADGLLYDSAFTRDRFGFRFPVAEHVRERVAYLSCNFDDYASVPTNEGNAGHVLLVGNDHEHKGMAQALDLLPRAFPHEQFVVIGYDDLGHPNVRSIKSGKVPHDEMQRLFADARMLVFPSFYEGFGFPVVKGLAHGLDVVARRSSLLSEIAGQCAPRGRIVPFDDPASLIDTISRILAGKGVETLPLGGSLAPGTEPLRWRDVASRIIGLLDDLAAAPSTLGYDRREAALRTVWPAGYSASRT